MDFADYCPPIVVERVQKADLASAENSGLFSWIANEAELECQVHAIKAVAERLTADSHPQVIDDFSNSVATYARLLPPEAVASIRAAYLRFPYFEANASDYFAALRLTGIDIRGHLKGKIREDWAFTQPRRDAATWHYYMYLASLGEPGAIDALAAKIAETDNGNDATNLLQSLSELKAEGVTEVLRLYENDLRRADDPEGPGMTIAESVAVFLQMRSVQ
jgi:hypothetical protein